MQFFHTGKQIKRNLFCYLRDTSKLWGAWSLSLPVHNFLSHLLFTIWEKWCQNMGIWYYHGAFPDTFTPDIDFIDEAVVQYYDVPIVKMLL